MKTKNIYLYDPVGWDNATPQILQSTIDTAESEGYDHFVLFINSPGGSVYDAIAIFNMLASRNVEIVITGQAASAAGYIAMAGKTRKIYSNSTFMIHSISTMAHGNEKEIKKVSENMETLKGLIAGNYAKATGRTVEEVLADMEAGDKGEIMTAASAKEKGYVTEIIQPGNAERNTIMFDYLMSIGIIETDNQAPQGQEKGVEMKFSKENLLKLGLDENATEDQVNAAMQNYMIEPKADDTPPPAQPASNNSDIEARMAAIEANINTEKVTTLIADAIKNGKILPADKEAYLALAEKDYEKTKTDIEAKAAVSPTAITPPADADSKTVKSPRMAAEESIRTSMKLEGTIK